MARATQSENQHYVPKMLLRNFATSKGDQIHVFDKQTGRSFLSNLKKVAAERNFYNIVFEGRHGSIEPNLGRLETVTAETLRKVNTTKSLGVLSAEDRIWLGIFIAAQHVRVRTFREMSKAFDEHLTAKILEMGGDPQNVEGWRPFTDEQDLKNFAISFLIRSIPNFSNIMENKIWVLMETKKSDPFWISDNPVTMHNEKTFGSFGNLGLAVMGVQIHLPISSTLTIALWCPSTLEEIQKVTNEAKSAQKRLRFQRLFGIRHDQSALDGLLLRHDHVIKFNDDMMARIGDGRPLLCTTENVMFFNSLQVLWSERYVMSWKRDFPLAEQMIGNNPRNRYGPRMTID